MWNFSDLFYNNCLYVQPAVDQLAPFILMKIKSKTFGCNLSGNHNFRMAFVNFNDIGS